MPSLLRCGYGPPHRIATPRFHRGSQRRTPVDQAGQKQKKMTLTYFTRYYAPGALLRVRVMALALGCLLLHPGFGLLLPDPAA